MKAKHHFWTSLAAGGAVYWATGSSAALAGSIVGGFLIDADHLIDQLWSIRHGAPFRREPLPLSPGDAPAQKIRVWLTKYFRPRKLLRLPLVFHSYELLSAIAALTIMLRTPFSIGLLSGYVLHLLLDMIRHHHEFRSPLFYLLTYRLSKRFQRDRLIKPEYL
jgi:hypothetical protein